MTPRAVLDKAIDLLNERKKARPKRKRYAGPMAVACEVCGWFAFVEPHHLLPVSVGGTDDPSNIMTLCPNHHRLTHRLFSGKKYWNGPILREVLKAALIAAEFSDDPKSVAKLFKSPL